MINGCKMLDIYIMCSLLPIYNGPKATIVPHDTRFSLAKLGLCSGSTWSMTPSHNKKYPNSTTITSTLVCGGFWHRIWCGQQNSHIRCQWKCDRWSSMQMMITINAWCAVIGCWHGGGWSQMEMMVGTTAQCTVIVVISAWLGHDCAATNLLT